MSKRRICVVQWVGGDKAMSESCVAGVIAHRTVPCRTVVVERESWAGRLSLGFRMSNENESNSENGARMNGSLWV